MKKLLMCCLLIFSMTPLLLFATTWTKRSFTVNKGDILTAINATDWTGHPDNFVVAVNPSTGVQTVLAAGGSTGDAPPSYFVKTSAAVLLDDGNVLVTDQGSGSGPTGDNRGHLVVVNKYDGSVKRVLIAGPCTSSPYTGCWYSPFSLTVDANGRIYVADSGYNPSTIGSGVQDAQVVQVIPAARDSQGRYQETNQWTMKRIAPLRNTNNALADGYTNYLTKPFGITTEANGDIVVADSGAFGGTGGIIKINPFTGEQTVLWGPSSYTGQPSGYSPIIAVSNPSSRALRCPMGITVNKAVSTEEFTLTNFLFHTDNGDYGCTDTPGIYRVNMTNNSTNTPFDVINNSVNWNYPFGIISGTDGYHTFLSEGYGTIYRIDSSGSYYVQRLCCVVIDRQQQHQWRRPEDVF